MVHAQPALEEGVSILGFSSGLPTSSCAILSSLVQGSRWFSQSPEWHPPLVHQVVHHHHLQIPKLKTTWYKHHGWHVHACMHACGSWDAKMSTKSNSVRAWHGQKTTQYLNCHRPPHSLLPYTHKRHIVNCMCSMVGHPRLAKISKTDGLGDSSQHHGRSFESQDLWAHEVALCMHGHACNQHVHM